MRADDPELELFRREVSCAALLERWPAGWRLDRRESTRRALKYRRGEGEIVIINHDGHGWWDPLSSAKGDVFDLVRHLDPSLNFRQVCKELRRLINVAPTFPAALAAAAGADIVRDGSFRSAWFAHHRGDGTVSHVEIRGPDYRGSLRGGTKTLFRFGRAGKGGRLAVTEAPIDALSLAAIDGRRADTLYVATGGGIGPGTLSALRDAIGVIAAVPGACLVAATDANQAGDRYADRLSEIAAEAGISVERLRPIGATDWNDILQGRTE